MYSSAFFDRRCEWSQIAVVHVSIDYARPRGNWIEVSGESSTSTSQGFSPKILLESLRLRMLNHHGALGPNGRNRKNNPKRRSMILSFVCLKRR